MNLFFVLVHKKTLHTLALHVHEVINSEMLLLPVEISKT